MFNFTAHTVFLFNQQTNFVFMSWSSSDFFNWNKVKIRYCDGGSFAGHPESEFKASSPDFFHVVQELVY